MNNDRLYELLPAIYRIRDAEQGEPLRALLQVIGEQVNLVEEDIARLYDNWFIETCEDWVVPYIADLVGYQPVHEAGEPGDVRTAARCGTQQDTDPTPRSCQHHPVPQTQGHAGLVGTTGERYRGMAGAGGGVLQIARLDPGAQSFASGTGAHGRSAPQRSVGPARAALSTNWHTPWTCGVSIPKARWAATTFRASACSSGG